MKESRDVAHPSSKPPACLSPTYHPERRGRLVCLSFSPLSAKIGSSSSFCPEIMSLWLCCARDQIQIQLPVLPHIICIIIEVCSTCEIGRLRDARQPSPGTANPDPSTPKPKEQPTPCDASPTFSARLYDDAPHNMLLSIEKLRGICASTSKFVR